MQKTSFSSEKRFMTIMVSFLESAWKSYGLMLSWADLIHSVKDFSFLDIYFIFKKCPNPESQRIVALKTLSEIIMLTKWFLQRKSC
jgi:hypothetical protein